MFGPSPGGVFAGRHQGQSWVGSVPLTHVPSHVSPCAGGGQRNTPSTPAWGCHPECSSAAHPAAVQRVCGPPCVCFGVERAALQPLWKVKHLPVFPFPCGRKEGAVGGSAREWNISQGWGAESAFLLPFCNHLRISAGFIPAQESQIPEL